MTTRVISTDQLRRRVNQGIKLLDERVPGWHHRVCTNTLVMAEFDNCVIGQLFDGDYEYGMMTLTGSTDVDTCYLFTVDHGFDLGISETLNDEGKVDYEPFARLTDLWRCQVISRQLRAG